MHLRLRSIPFRDYLLLDINVVVRMLILSDMVWYGALGLLGPVFAIFIVDFIDGGSATVAGIAASIYLITKSVMQVPAATIVDRIKGELDDYWVMCIGSVLAAILPIFYLFVNTPGELYFIQFLYGIFLAATFPSYMAIFTRHVDKHKEATSWGVYYTLNDFTAAVAASVGGVLAETVGFHTLIVIVVLISLTGAALLFPIKPFMKQYVPKKKPA